MSRVDLALEGKLAAVRLASSRLPRHLRPTPTHVALPEAALALGMSVTRLKLTLRGRRLRAERLGSERVLPLAVFKALR